ncbi:cobalamin B12-binding domain-containing protein [Bradyrhizobium erythrophlei]|uniref:cobalamin B12-binding domain-containing protein n=1 Tax=Bradyrhizobium erythrophlei TaxID=1437360 RepID=UPI0035E8BD94
MSTLKGKRILIAKPGLDGHDIGAKIIALALRDAGAEVIYTGLRKTPGFTARVAVDEDVDAVGLSLLSGSHKELVAETMQELRALDADDIPVFVGGTIPVEDRAALMETGVTGIFTAEMRLDDVVAEVARVLAPVRAA